MRFHLFAVSTLLGLEVTTKNGIVIGQLEDIVCDKTSGYITYFLLTTSHTGTEASDSIYAIHHTYFHLSGDDESLAFNPERGSNRHVSVPPLPSFYETVTIKSYQEFKQQVLPHLAQAGHRSDND